MPQDYWSVDLDELMRRLGSSGTGLAGEDAARRLRQAVPDRQRFSARWPRLTVFVRQIRSPLLLLLLFAAGAAGATGEWRDAAMVLLILGVTIGIGYSREYRADRAAAALAARVGARATVLRDGTARTVLRDDVVPGDVVLLSAGAVVPGDARLLDASDLFVSQSALTGESFPVEKSPGLVPAQSGLSDRTNCVFLGSNVRSGAGRALVVRTGTGTELGTVSTRLRLPPPESDFDRGIRRFGYVLTSAMLVLVLLVFLVHVLNGRPPVETLLFAVALAVGLSPELLPAVLSVNLARGAQMLAQRGVLVRRLTAIENLGSMNVFCTDKTGTLTEGVVQVDGSYDPDGASSSRALQLAAINAALGTGFANPLDTAILQSAPQDPSTLTKISELPFDFSRRRMSIATAHGADVLLITKGAYEAVIPACARDASGRPLDAARRAALDALCDGFSGQGVRVLAVASRVLPAGHVCRREDETDLTLEGLITFSDRPKEGVREALGHLTRLGVTVKMITGDHPLVAAHVASRIGLPASPVVTGSMLARLDAAGVRRTVELAPIFAQVDPNQKERIIRALRDNGHVVGFLGDGVNDAPAIHAADAGLSVDQAVDVAREAADLVLLERDLDVIRGGIEAGRRTFANTQKYILTTTSANLGNMLSMAAASLALPFLPLTAGQILLNNLLSDVPAIGIADDRVDAEWVQQPPRWDMRFLGRFMVEFGVLSSVFDVLTFSVLIFAFQAPVALFQTGWFVESLLTELAIALVVRTRVRSDRSRPGTLLVWLTAAVAIVAVSLPYLPVGSAFGFVPLPPLALLAVVGITAMYVVAAEAGKAWFYRTRRVTVRR